MLRRNHPVFSDPFPPSYAYKVEGGVMESGVVFPKEGEFSTPGTGTSSGTGTGSGSDSDFLIRGDFTRGESANDDASELAVRLVVVANNCRCRGLLAEDGEGNGNSTPYLLATSLTIWPNLSTCPLLNVAVVMLLNRQTKENNTLPPLS